MKSRKNTKNMTLHQRLIRAAAGLALLPIAMGVYAQPAFATDTAAPARLSGTGVESVYYRDLTGDGKINADDAREALLIASKLRAEGENSTAGDIDGDGRVSSADARRILRFASRLEPFSSPGDADAPLAELAAADLKYVDEICRYSLVNAPMVRLLRERDFDTLIYEFNLAGFNEADDERMLIYSGVIAEKAADLPPERLTAEILNENNAPLLRRVLTEMCPAVLTSEDQYAPLLPLLERDDPDPDDVFDILDGLSALPDPSPFERYAERFVREGGEDIAPFALKLLCLHSTQKGKALCNEILAGFDGGVDDMTRTAIICKSIVLQNDSTPDERTELIGLIDGILHSPATEDADSDYMALALGSMHSPESMAYLLAHADEPEISGFLEYFIGENIDVLREMAKAENPDPAVLEAVEEYDKF